MTKYTVSFRGANVVSEPGIQSPETWPLDSGPGARRRPGMTEMSRRSVLLGAGALVVSIGAAVSLDTVFSIEAAHAQGVKPPLTPDQLSS